MCLSLCPRRNVLFWNHDDCDGHECVFAAGPHGPCATCRHCQDSVCALTNAPLPASGECCQHDVEPVTGRQEISWDMLSPLRIGPDEMVEQVLKCYEVPYAHGPRSEVLIDPDDLGLPQTFGVGTEHLVEEDFDWTDCGQ